MIAGLAQCMDGTDLELLLRHQSGAEGAFSDLYERYGRKLHFFAHSMTGNQAHAEDVVQETFLRLLRVEPASIRHSVGGLLFQIALNLLRHEFRRTALRKKTYPKLLAQSREFTEGAEGAADRMELLSWALSQIPLEQREVVVLKTKLDMTFREIAEVSGIPEATAKSRYRYGINRMAELLPDEEETR